LQWPPPGNMGRSSESEKVPHFALPNFSVVLPTFSNHESDVITQAFRIGNYVSLSSLPNTVRPGQVSRSRFQKILDNRQPSDAEPTAYKPKAKYFSEFEYMPSPFSMADEVAKVERLASEAKVREAGHTATFRMSDTSVRLRYEDAFGNDLDTGGNADPYERADDQALRFKWLQDAQILAGPFRPAGRVKGQMGQAASEMPSRASMPHIVDQIREAIEEDWSEYAFLVCSTDDEHVVVRFELSTLDSEPGLVAYMNMFARSNRVVNSLMLRKVVEDWNVTPGDGHLYFTFRPPWVATRMTDAFFALHPEQRVFQDPRLKRASQGSTHLPGGTSSELPSSMKADSAAGSGAVQRPNLV